MKTKERLARELGKAKAPEEIVYLAKKGHYDDYESDLPLPLHELIGDLIAAGMEDFAQRVRDGEFDGTNEEGDEWFESVGRHLLGQ